MTLSVPSFLAAATSEFMPPPAEAEVCVAQLVLLPLEPVEEPDDEQPAANSVATATPASANRYEDLISASWKLPYPRSGLRLPGRATGGGTTRFADPPLPQLRVQDKRT